MKSKKLRPITPEYISEKSISFRKEPEGGFRKITSVSIRNLRTNKLETEEEESEELYELISGSNFDHEMIVQDPDGNEVILRFKSLSDK